jgi:hypothetical protein
MQELMLILVSWMAQRCSKLVVPWVRTGHVVRVDSHFAPISATVKLKRLLGLHFIGVVKTASCMYWYSQDYLSRLKLSNRGEREGIYCKAEGSNDPLFMAFVWVDIQIGAISFLCHCSRMASHIAGSGGGRSTPKTQMQILRDLS